MKKCCMCEKDLRGVSWAIPLRAIDNPSKRVWVCSNRCWRVYFYLRGPDAR